MLGTAEKFVADDYASSDFPTSAPVLPLQPSALVSVVPDAFSRYGQHGRPNLPAILLILLVHAALIAVVVQARHHVQRVREAQLSVVNLTPPPPPPPAEEAPPPPPSQPQVIAPPPLVQVPVPPAPIATAPEPQPIQAPAAKSVSPGPIASAPAAPAAGPSTVQAGDLSAQMIAGKPPRYPTESRRKREQGTVVLSLILGTDGAVESLAIAQSSGFNRLDDAARDAIRTWRWKPVVRDGQPVRVKGIVEIPFVLRGA
ncbi:energy transducer TonB [Sphingobium bisphenolivorans]|uniref:energy transducer TonB n=1 Tax=Sphingobium bisphenolivorans TaxID=1335760 RepID=UPI0003A1DFA9|nr:energy transducer TonB [Sphingobium bisphenolivorans]